MNAFDRRRVVVASVFTLVALPALWVFNRESAATSTSPNVGAAGLDVGAGLHDTAPSTTAYEPSPPLFVGGDDAPNPPGLIDIAVPPAPGANDLLMKASYHRYIGAVGVPCTTLLAPDGAALTVTNVDNGQTAKCTNTLGLAVPAGAEIVLDTALFATIGDLADAPVPVRVRW
jgi:hypothetical protein